MVAVTARVAPFVSNKNHAGAQQAWSCRALCTRSPWEWVSSKLNLPSHKPVAAHNNAGSDHSPSTSMTASSQYRQLLGDHRNQSQGYNQTTESSQARRSKYAELPAIIKELSKDIRTTYASRKTTMCRLKRDICRELGLVPTAWLSLNGMPAPSRLALKL